LFLCVDDVNLWSGDWVTYFTREDAELDAELDDREEPDDKDYERLRALGASWERWRDCAATGLRTNGAARAARAFARARRGHWDESLFRNVEDIEALLLEFVRHHPEGFRPARGGAT
jgi:hypothetical protein